MFVLTDDFLMQLAGRLSGLPKTDNAPSRNQSWMTAKEISKWWNGVCGDDTPHDESLDLLLVQGWRSDSRFTELQIRPAKYPDRKTMCRLWGHESVVGRRPCGEIEQWKTSDPESFYPPINSRRGAKVFFLSHSMDDRALTLGVRGSLVERGYVPWLAEEKIERGELVFESVREAVYASFKSLVLLGRNALGSAWVETEAACGVPTVVCDGGDEELKRLLESWRFPGDFDRDLLEPLASAYREDWRESHGALGGAAGGLSVHRQRPDKYCDGAKRLLVEQLQRSPYLCIYPAKPPDWAGDQRFIGFGEAIGRLAQLEG